MCLVQVTMGLEVDNMKDVENFEEKLSTKNLNFNRESHDIIIGEQDLDTEDGYQKITNEISEFNSFSSEKSQKINNFNKEDMRLTNDFTMYPRHSETLMSTGEHELGAECSSNCKQCLNSTHCETCSGNNINQLGQCVVNVDFMKYLVPVFCSLVFTIAAIKAWKYGSASEVCGVTGWIVGYLFFEVVHLELDVFADTFILPVIDPLPIFLCPYIFMIVPFFMMAIFFNPGGVVYWRIAQVYSWIILAAMFVLIVLYCTGFKKPETLRWLLRVSKHNFVTFIGAMIFSSYHLIKGNLLAMNFIAVVTSAIAWVTHFVIYFVHVMPGWAETIIHGTDINTLPAGIMLGGVKTNVPALNFTLFNMVKGPCIWLSNIVMMLGWNRFYEDGYPAVYVGAAMYYACEMSGSIYLVAAMPFKTKFTNGLEIANRLQYMVAFMAFIYLVLAEHITDYSVRRNYYILVVIVFMMFPTGFLVFGTYEVLVRAYRYFIQPTKATKQAQGLMDDKESLMGKNKLTSSSSAYQAPRKQPLHPLSNGSYHENVEEDRIHSINDSIIGEPSYNGIN